MKDEKESTGHAASSLSARVLFLHEQTPDYQTQTAVEQLSRGTGGRATALTVGRGGTFATPVVAVLNLRNHLDGVDLIHTFGESALTIAAIAGRGKKIIYSPIRFPTWRDLRWVRAVMGARDVHVVCPTDTMRRAFVQRGVPIQRCHLIRPGVEFARINRRRNDELRAQLGFEKDDFVLLGAGESVRGANHHATILAASVLHVYDPKYKLLMWGRGPMVRFERNYSARMLPEHFMAWATSKLPNVRFDELMAAADAVLITADGPIPPLAIAVSMAAGLPIVAAVSETISEMLEDRHNCLMVGRSTSRLLARRILDLREDPRLQWSICDAARTEAYEYFSMTRFLNQYQAIYEQIAAGKKVELAQTQPGAGSRFFGRV